MFFLIFFPSPLVQQADAQFVDLLLEVEPELSASVEKPLNFGTVTTNSGRKVISLGDFDMGIFSITALQNQQLALSLNFPSALENEDPSIPNVIPIDLRARYGFNRNNVRESYSITSGMTSFSMESHNGNTPWAKVFIYIFGTIQVGDIPEGTYSENIVLYVEYI